MAPASGAIMSLDWLDAHGSLTEEEPDEVRFARPRLDGRLVTAARAFNRLLRRYHPVRLDGAEHLPRGPALLVGNHGLVGYETMLFFDELMQHTGRHPLGLADRWFFRVPGLREALVRLGGIYGNFDNAVRALHDGNLVVCYPGGAREVLKGTPESHYGLQWAQSQGFIRVALAAGVPIIPFAAAGVDDTYDVLMVLRGTGEAMMGHPKYDLPLFWARGPLPRPVPFWFRIGRPIHLEGDARDPQLVMRHHSRLWRTTQRLLDGLVSDWKTAHHKEAAPCAS